LRVRRRVCSVVVCNGQVPKLPTNRPRKQQVEKGPVSVPMVWETVCVNSPTEIGMVGIRTQRQRSPPRAGRCAGALEEPASADAAGLRTQKWSAHHSASNPALNWERRARESRFANARLQGALMVRDVVPSREEGMARECSNLPARYHSPSH